MKAVISSPAREQGSDPEQRVPGFQGMYHHNPLCDERLKNPKEKLLVLFDGSITLWRSGTNLDVLVVYHELFNCIELVVYESATDLEAPRIYLDASRVFSKMTPETLSSMVNEKRELCLRQKKDFSLEAVERALLLEFAANYAVTRIALNSNARVKGAFSVYLQPKYSDSLIKRSPINHTRGFAGRALDGSCLDVVIAKPDVVIPIRTVHFARLSPTALDDWIDGFHHATATIAADEKKAAQLLQIVSAFMDTTSSKMRISHQQKGAIARLRWARAINRVIHKNLSARMRILVLQLYPPETLSAKIRRLAPLKPVDPSAANVELTFSKEMADKLKQFANGISEIDLKHLIQTTQEQRGLKDSSFSAISRESSHNHLEPTRGIGVLPQNALTDKAGNDCNAETARIVYSASDMKLLPVQLVPVVSTVHQPVAQSPPPLPAKGTLKARLGAFLDRRKSSTSTYSNSDANLISLPGNNLSDSRYLSPLRLPQKNKPTTIGGTELSSSRRIVATSGSRSGSITIAAGAKTNRSCSFRLQHSPQNALLTSLPRK